MKRKKSDIEKIETIDDAYVQAFRYVMQRATAPKVVRQAGQLNMVEVDGHKVYRQDKIMVNGELVKCAPTDNHFVYRIDPAIFHRLGWLLFCTCGSPAVTVSPDAYKHLGSAEGTMLVCKSMLDTGRHSGGGM